jgi:hypothetical protein
MSATQSSVSDMLVTVKSREIQRGMLAEMRHDKAGTVRHLLAAAHLELVLADDYAAAGDKEMAMSSQISAASCFWRAGHVEEAQQLFDTLARANPGEESSIKELISELQRDCPKLAS